jgi:hypothetical protein
MPVTCLTIWIYGLKKQFGNFHLCLETILTHVQETENCYKIHVTQPCFVCHDSFGSGRLMH